MMYSFIIFCFLLCSSVSCANFDVNNVKVISSISNSDTGYFGYSLLLQRGLKPIVIVGAPKGIVDKGGAVYSCDLSGHCEEYMLLVRDPYGNFLGSVLDGDDNVGQPFIACAPRMLKLYGNYAAKYYLPGYCLYQRNSSYLSRLDSILSPLANQKEISTASGINYYDYGFSETGMDMHYIKDSAWVVLGAPGVKNWNGAFVVQSLEKPSQFSIFPKKLVPVLSENDAYLGYKVTIGKFERTRKHISFIASAPRGNKLFGMVKIFEGALLSRVLTGNELGSYFGGALLATDLNADGIDELLVGAPMGSGNSFDEGYVYIYDNSMKFMMKLTGSRKAGARFGSAIVSLGDIDIDNFNDIAISAPYEDDGVGAVYIYRGNKYGIELVPSQRLSPLNFNGGLHNVRGFGQGISRGNDIDGNGHNDLAVGAYKSNQVFVVKTLSIIDYKIALETDISSIPPNKMEIPTNIKYCIYYTQRSKTKNVKSVNFNVELQLDYRTNGTRKFVDKWTVFLAETFCKTLDVIIMQSMLDIQPFQLFMRVEVIDNVFAVGENEMERSIPYAHNCGEDNICHTQILINVESQSTHIVLGLDKEFEVHIMADNVGEPGYQCRLYLEIPPELEYSERRNCNFDNDIFICPFASILVSSVETNLKFYVISKNILADNLEISFEIKCLGENAMPNKETLSMDILWHNSPYMQSKSEPEKYIRTDNNIEEELTIYHTFIVGNYGPSPIKLDVTLLVPIVKENEMDIFEFIEAKGILNDMHIPCHSTNESKSQEKSYDFAKVINEAANRTIVVDCFTDGIECMEIICDGGYLYKSSETAKYTINIKTNKKLLASHFRDTLKKKDVVAYLSSAFLYNTTAKIERTSATLIYQSTKQTISLWIAIVSCILGLLFLVILIYVLYKCHFFDRTYRDKLHGERLINENIEMDITANTTEYETDENLGENHKDINS